MPTSISSSTILSRTLRVHIVANRLSVSPRTVRWWAKTGRLTAYKGGPRIWLFLEADVEAFKLGRSCS
jgi:excisionase family DNA binding protein